MDLALLDRAIELVKPIITIEDIPSHIVTNITIVYKGLKDIEKEEKDVQ